MWLKLLVISISLLSFIEAGNPRKFNRPTVANYQDFEVLPLVDPFDGISYRLPNNTVPLTYDIFLSTDIHRGEFAFNGTVKARFVVLQTSNEVVLHYRQMNILSVTLFNANNQVIQQNVPWIQNATVEFLIITPNVPFFQGLQYFVEIVYSGIIRDDSLGWYRASYVNPQGERKWLATTQFQANEARHAFPCWDEPGRRSLFTVAIRHDASYIALSNMPEVFKTQVPGTNYVVTRFAETLSMQSYLVAFTVSDFIYVEEASVVPPQRIYGKTQSILNGDGDMALKASVKIMAKFEEYLQIPYSFPKMDQFACPDFAFGAMENWGLAIYREPLLLFNDVVDRTRDQENIVTIVSHEFAHQWFGNLVSPEWWTFLWINEGFATLYEFYLTHITFPGQRYMDNFLVSYQRAALEFDANPNVRAMSKYVENPDNIESLFDIVGYQKAGSVFYMIQNAFTDATWSKGISYFLRERAFNFVNADHLYAGLQRAVNEDFPFNPLNVASIMRTWEFQAGFPVITVRRSQNELTFSQERFFYGNQNSANIWWVPINYVTASNPNFSVTSPDFWLSSRELRVQRESAPKPWAANDWIIVNVQLTGYYRVNYDDALWTSIIRQLNAPGTGFEAIEKTNRAQLIDDSFHLARSGRIGFDVMMEIMNYMERETDYLPWGMLNRAHTLLNRWLTGTSVYPNYQAFVRKNVNEIYNKLGVKIIANEMRVDRYGREIAINLACQAGSTRCLVETAQELSTSIRTGAPIAPDLEAAIYCNGVRRANSFTVAFMQFKLLTSTRQFQRNTIITGLGCIESAQILRSHLSFALEPFELSSGERIRILESPVNNGETSLRVMMNFIRDNFVQINLIRAGQVATLCSNIAPRVSSEQLFNEFDVFLMFLQVRGAITTEQGISYRRTAIVNLQWQVDNLNDFIRFFDRS